MRVTQIFLSFFCNSFFFVYRHSDLEGSCSNETITRHGESRCCLRAVAGHEMWHWAGRFETFTERNCWAYDACAEEVWTEGSFTLALFQGRGMGSEVLLEQVQLNLSSRNKFIILLPYGFQKITHYKKCASLQVLLAALIMVVKSWRRIRPTLIYCRRQVSFRPCIIPYPPFSSTTSSMYDIFFWSSAQKLRII
jgi:hypothetical protein